MTFHVIPYSFYESGTTYFWVHFGLVILGFVVALATCIGQWVKPAPYGKHEREDPNWGPKIPQRLSHIISDALTGIIMFSLVFFLYSREVADKGVLNYVFYGLFLIHTLHRGLLHPLTMRYRSATVPIGITIGGLLPNVLYQWLIANHIGVAGYDSSYPYDPRFLLGILLYVIGFVINRWADWKLRSLREIKGCNGYYIPYGGLFDLIACPNYFGELVQWIGWTLATWSLSGVVWTLFCAATFFARSRHNLQWYRDQFQHYPPNRKALIPFIF
ncbi:steroid 5-alpha-reductase DET2 isoform X2 [Aplysia californica]|uniref:Steroid 5-alpha-reductase DET2 isoform X2 n=1 Tax=Aplysia californica TaxID=6500 RepID=A0ABM0K9L8_APLCA|nr:steroid 5-alpha-reductase DET2 isoform X2 [Aplysia californica]